MKDPQMTKRVVRMGGRRTGAVSLPSYTVAALPVASGQTGRLVYVTNGAAGTAVAAWSDGTNWKRADTGATAAAS